MSDYKYPKDGTSSGKESLTVNKTIMFPEERMEDGSICAFEILIEGATSLDTNVSFKIYSALDSDALDAVNIPESIVSSNLTGLTGKLVFQRLIVDTLNMMFKIVISGTNASSTATFLIRARSK